MNAEARKALATERDDLERQRRKRLASDTPHAAALAMIDARLAEIAALINAPEPDPAA